MPEASTRAQAAPAEPPTVNLAPQPAVVPAPPQAVPPVPPGPPRARNVVPAEARSRPRWRRWLRTAALVIALPVAALGIGLLIAWIVHTIRGNPSIATGPPPQPQSSVSPVASAPPSQSPSAAPQQAVVPADWVVESDPPAGLTFRHPPGWIRRTALPEILRFAPVSAGSTTPGIEGIGAGIEQSADPTQALGQFVTRAYGGQPQLQTGAVTPVTGGHPGEQQEDVSYVRAGVPVQIVVHAFSSNGASVIVLARAASADSGRAGELEAAVEASLQISG